MPRRLRPNLIQALVCFTAICCLLQTGCVRRRLLVRSNPSGAMVYVDNQPIGMTPCATDFTYYGTREIRLVKAGYETLTVNQPLPAPWYQIAPLDFVSENIVPSKIQDYRTASFNMVPQVIVPTEQLIANGEQLRRSTQQGVVAPGNVSVVPNLLLPPAQPTLGTPVLAPPQGNYTSPPADFPPGSLIAPRSVPGMLPSGGQTLEAFPPPRR